MSTQPLVDPSNPRDMALFGAACVLAKHLAYGAAEAFLNVPSTTTPMALWAGVHGLERETWIRRAMDVLRTLDPSSRRQIAHLYRDDNVIAFIAPASPVVGCSHAPTDDGEGPSVPNGEDSGQSLCIWCSAYDVTPECEPYCSNRCAAQARCEGA